MDFTLSAGQENALRAIERWLAAPSQPFFYLAGYAGTGKTSIARRLVENRKAVYAAYTGKAADVMARSGCVGATTIHKLIYRPAGWGDDPAVAALRAEIVELSHRVPTPRAEIAAAVGRLQELKAQSGGAGFVLDRENPAISECDIIVLDECSMLGAEMMSDLMSFGKPILVLGDVGQLPPVKAAGFFQSRTPDAMLTEVHRQALDSGVLQIATMIREGRKPAVGRYGLEGSIVCHVDNVGKDTMRQADQVLCGYNKTKAAINTMMRGPRAPLLPVTGDKLVCLRNNHERGYYNGSTMVAVADTFERGRSAWAMVERDGIVERVEMDRAAIAGAGAGNDFDLIALEYAWAMTCHKAQGSQWPRVLVIDESDVARDHARSWLYTASSRASEQLVLALR